MYKSILGIRQTQTAIKSCKDYFERELANSLNLTRVSAPLFVTPESGLNDALNGTERPVQFDILETGKDVQIVQSLAKWKRYALGKYGFEPGEGLYTDMNAIRRDETTDALHSLYVDQWVWEKVITKEERTLETLMKTVKRIYRVLKSTEQHMSYHYPELREAYEECHLPEEITFITTQEREDLYPDLTAKERENAFTREKKAVCLMKIGGILNSGKKHDGRSPDYDDWEMNCDILLYYPVLDIALEISSMGVRVDSAALDKQLTLSGCDDRRELFYHKAILEDSLPLTIGGGIGQSRLCMFYLRKIHIGEVQASVWPEEQEKALAENGCILL